MSKIIILELDRLEMYKKPSVHSFTLKRSSNRAKMGTPKPLSLKTTRRLTKNAPKVGEKLGWAHVEVLKDVLEERV